MNYVMGVDPGLSGAWAIYDRQSKRLLCVDDMPRTPEGKLDAAALASAIDIWCAGNIAFAVIEKVSGGTYTSAKGEKRGQGSAASFSFGKYAGVVHGILAAMQVKTYSVPPSVWKLTMGLSRDKTSSRTLAAHRFPTFSASFSRKKDDGRAEAALLAVFGAERFK